MNKNNEILVEFNNNLKIYEEFSDKIKILINEILVNEQINFQKIECRVKSYNSLNNKLIKKDKYNNISDIKDIIGLRIILYYNEDIDKVQKIMEKEFESDLINFSDKREKEYNVFGYSSLHLILRINNKRSELLEYKKYKGIFLNYK